MSSSETNGTFFLTPQAKGFGSFSPADDSLHQEMNAQVADPALTETQYLGFSVPDAGIHALNYLWAHPNLGLVTGGVWAWQGIKRRTLAAELFDMRMFMDDEPLRKGDLLDVELPSGYRVKVLAPLEKIHVSYEDESRQNAFDVTLTAIMPPAMLPSGKHFDQAMRTEGTLLLRGRRHQVDGYTVRDRSWAEARSEAPRNGPPLLWMTSVFDDRFAIHVTGFEDPASDPVWKDVYAPDPALNAINRGWLWLDGELSPLESATFTTTWDRDTGYPRGHAVRAVAASGRELTLEGTITAACNWSAWSNVSMIVCLTRWECEGRTGWGDTQAAYWTDFAHGLLD